MTRLQLNPCFKLRSLPPHGLVLHSENHNYLVEDETACRILKRLRTPRTQAELVETFAGEVSQATIAKLTRQLLARHYVVALPEQPSGHLALYGQLDPAYPAKILEGALRNQSVSLEGGSAALREMTRNTLVDLGVTVTSLQHATLHVVLAGDHLDADLAGINKRQLAGSQPWWLVSLSHTQIWLGPLFVPGTTACWRCLAHRLERNRPIQRLLSPIADDDTAPIDPAIGFGHSIGVQLLALELIKLLLGGLKAGHDKLRIVHLHTLDSTQHRLQPRRRCPACTPAAPSGTHAPSTQSRITQADLTAPLGGRARSVMAVANEWSHLVDPVCGVVRRLKHLPIAAGQLGTSAIALHHDVSAGSGPGALYENLRGRSAGWGRHSDDARAAALCEALERSSAHYQGHEPVTIASFKSLHGHAIHPNACALYSAQQLAEAPTPHTGRGEPAGTAQASPSPSPFDPDQPIAWTALWNLTRGDHSYLPTRCCYHDSPHPPHDLRADNNGTAAGSTRAEALGHALLELLERDAAAIWWYQRLRRPALDLHRWQDRSIDGWLEVYRAAGRSLTVLDITTDLGIPSCVAVAADKNGERITLGFGAHAEMRSAARRALQELHQSFEPVMAHTRGALPITTEFDRRIVRFWDQVTVANNPQLAACKPTAGPTPGEALAPATATTAPLSVADLVERLASRGLEVLALDMTREDIGLPVVKAWVPGLRPHWRRLAPGRLYQVPILLGDRASTNHEHQLNRWDLPL